MPLGNPRSIVKQTVLLYSFLQNLRLMTFPYNWFICTVFLIAAFGALINPPAYIAIALLFFLIGMMLLPTKDKLTSNYFHWHAKGGIKRTIVLVSLIVVCLIVPQVETNTAIFTSPIEDLKNQMCLV